MASEEAVSVVAGDASSPLEIVSSHEEGLNPCVAIAAADQQHTVAAEQPDAAIEAAEDENKGVKRSRQDPEQKLEDVGGESGDIEEIIANDGQEPVSKKAKAEQDNGDARLESIEGENGCGKVSDENVMDEVAEAEAQEPVAEKDELGSLVEKPESKEVAPVQLGPKVFQSGAQMFTFFYDLLHGWVVDYDLNKYETLVLSDLILKGHQEAEKKIGQGIKAFQVKKHPKWHSRCYYLVRTDGTLEDFSYRKCVNHLMPLPPDLFLPSGALNLDELLPDGRDRRIEGDESKGKDGQAGFKGSHGGRGNGGGRRGGHRGRGRYYRR
ncbi:hypothetical protein O6H91_18G020200 [Diphasiastrum complanatum]|uniref:Uncharacterized protein n=1 Tax=Diphasiastrum complanatum TaxID=34168 RepID=A0ACC2AYK4_DIPCM|nr:hypothetical protein O6H91_18G020200 [Diphasiastrum complanatum]